jgi:hypothetical protein
MDTTCLNNEDASRVGELISKHGIQEFDAFVRFWGRKSTVQIDGDLNSKELRRILEIAEYLEC